MKTRKQGGFTLIEVLIAVTILGIIVATLTAALIAYLHNGATNDRRGDTASKAGLVASYLTRDFASATQAVSPAPNQPAASWAPCPSPPASTKVALRLTWNDWTASTPSPSPVPTTNYAAEYMTMPDPSNTTYPGSPTRYQLVRITCSDDASPTPVSSNVLVPDLTSQTDFGIVPTPTPAATPCDTPSPGTTTKPTVVRLKQFESDSSVGNYNFAGCLGGRGQQ